MICVDTRASDIAGLAFSASEPTALRQQHGGPCGVLAPLQAFILARIAHQSPAALDVVRLHRGVDNMDHILVDAMVTIIAAASAGAGSPLSLVISKPPPPVQHQHEAISIDTLHASLKYMELASRDALTEAIFAHFLSFLEPYGVIQLLYSVVLTHGVDRVKSDQGIDIEPLISLPHGHASQSLINLMITGRATPYVWDNTQDAGGLGESL